MKYHPYTFKPHVAQANVEGRKTETRRLGFKSPKETAKLKEINQNPDYYSFSKTVIDPLTGNIGFVFIATGFQKQAIVINSGLAIGDIIWQRENFYYDGAAYYYTNSPQPFGKFKFKPAIHMPKEACRFWAEITGLRMERLQDITEAGAINEGIKERVIPVSDVLEDGSISVFNWGDNTNATQTYYTPIEAYKALWESINGPGSWDANPWVLVIQYKSIVKPDNWGE